MADIPITVLMPVYNAEAYLEKAINSILEQTFQDFEFLIIDDGSTDNTPEILESYHDPRIKIVHQDNKGVAVALRLGVELARGGYIARMDADDESLPKRLEIEKAYLDHNPEICLVHGMHDLIDENGMVIKNNCGRMRSNIETKWLLLWSNVITHPTVMVRKKKLSENGLNYRLETNGREDFDLWNRLARVGDFLYIPLVLLRFRIHYTSVTQRRAGNSYLQIDTEIISDNFKRYGVTISRQLAEEIVILSGQTIANPLNHPYQQLPGHLHEVYDELLAKFKATLPMARETFPSIQAQQLAQWARCLLHCTKGYAFQLLYRSFRYDKKIIFTRLFGLTLLALFLPKKLISWINRKRTQTILLFLTAKSGR